jgi:FAD/FMN-containing dehydrogenase
MHGPGRNTPRATFTRRVPVDRPGPAPDEASGAGQLRAIVRSDEVEVSTTPPPRDRSCGPAGSSDVLVTPDRAAEAHVRDWTRAFSASLAPWTTGAVYVNAIGGDVTEARKAAAYGGPAKLARLRRLKRTWDPGNLFRRNHNVAP